MVGALADWFAVTALFRHPLGLPIPHTAIIPAPQGPHRPRPRQVRAGQLPDPRRCSPSELRDASAWPASSARGWPSRRNAAPAAGERRRRARGRDRGAAATRTSSRRSRQVDRCARCDATPAAPLAGARRSRRRSRRPPPGAARHACCTGCRRCLEEQPRGCCASGSASESPWWVPEPIDDRRLRRSSSPACSGFLAEVAGDPDHELRRPARRAGSAELAVRLRTDPELAARGEELKDELLEHPDGAGVAGLAVARRSRRRSLAAADDPDVRPPPPARRRASCGRRSLQDDPALQAKVDGWIEQAVGYLVEQYRHEIADLIAAHRRPLGRRRGQPAHRAAGRPRPAVHPHQRHRGRRAGRSRHLLDRPAPLGRRGGPTSSSGRPRRPRSG